MLNSALCIAAPFLNPKLQKKNESGFFNEEKAFITQVK